VEVEKLSLKWHRHRASTSNVLFHFFHFSTFPILLVLFASSDAAGQLARPSLFALDTAASFDQTRTFDGDNSTGMILDAVMSVSLGAGFEGMIRPWAQRQASGEWNRQIWIAAVRYQRPGPIGLRVDAGLIPSPIGLSNLMLRPQLNPTVSLPASLFQSLPAIEVGGPRATLLGAVYAYGANATVSGTHWDARAAVIDTSPLRTRRIFSSTNPPRFDNVVIGGGITPFVGFRIGASVTHGGWQRANESPTITENRDATIVTIESEFSYRFTKLLGEWVRDTLETSGGGRVASGWFVQGQQTLTPRWFIAGRVERMSAPALTPLLSIERQHLNGVEETLGFRLTPELTLRIDHRARQGFGRPDFDHQVSLSAVWWKRWF
jgi:hypothetical protein